MQHMICILFQKKFLKNSDGILCCGMAYVNSDRNSGYESKQMFSLIYFLVALNLSDYCAILRVWLVVHSATDYKAFFIEIPNFWAWADNTL